MDNYTLEYIDKILEDKKEEIEQLKFIEVGRAQNLTHQTFERLYVLGRANGSMEKEPKRAYWWTICLNDGNIVKALGKSLLNGDKKSCGCLQKEKASKNAIIRNTSNNKPGFGNKKDLSQHEPFGYLIALEPTENRAEDGSIIWKCKCIKEGNICYVPSHLLLNGSVKSCGCLTSSGEAKIEQLLQSNNIKYKKQYTFSDLLSEKNSPLKFDFGILNSNNSLLYLIEYDGIQHFKCRGTGWNTEEHLEYTQQHDKMKEEYCKQKNIPLIRIPYTKFNNLKIEDLLYGN